MHCRIFRCDTGSDDAKVFAAAYPLPCLILQEPLQGFSVPYSHEARVGKNRLLVCISNGRNPWASRDLMPPALCQQVS